MGTEIAATSAVELLKLYGSTSNQNVPLLLKSATENTFRRKYSNSVRAHISLDEL